MRVVFWKIKVLWILLCDVFGAWKDEIWEAHPEDYACCSGGSGYWDICGCQGATLRDMYTPVNKKEKP